MKLALPFIFITLLFPSRILAFEVETLLENGSPSNRIDLVILGDGYRLEDQDKMNSDTEAFLDVFWNSTPYKEYKNFFNVALVHVVSNDNGADRGDFGEDRDTALGANFWCYDVERMLCVDYDAVYTLVAEDTPEYDFVFVIVNDTKYGGSGGEIAVFSSDDAASDIVTHEFGHSFANLADEYEEGEGYEPCIGSDCPEPNASLYFTFDKIKWNHWIEETTPLPTPNIKYFVDVVGAFEGGRYQKQGVYRPWLQCKMRVLGFTFCSVCAEAMVKGVYDIVSPIDGATPKEVVALTGEETAELKVQYPAPIPDTMTFHWTVGGLPVDETSNRFTVQADTLGSGISQVSVLVRDDTALVREDTDHLLEATHTWAIEVSGIVSSDAGADADADTDADGDDDSDMDIDTDTDEVTDGGSDGDDAGPASTTTRTSTSSCDCRSSAGRQTHGTPILLDILTRAF
jgi:hypothetical protein